MSTLGYVLGGGSAQYTICMMRSFLIYLDFGRVQLSVLRPPVPPPHRATCKGGAGSLTHSQGQAMQSQSGGHTDTPADEASPRKRLHPVP